MSDEEIVVEFETQLPEIVVEFSETGQPGPPGPPGPSGEASDFPIDPVLLFENALA